MWWAWIYTTWMVNWFDPRSGAVRLVLVGVSLASLLMSAAIPNAFGSDSILFASAYVAMQVGRNIAGVRLLLSLITCCIGRLSGSSSGAWLPASFGWPGVSSRAPFGRAVGGRRWPSI